MSFAIRFGAVCTLAMLLPFEASAQSPSPSSRFVEGPELEERRQRAREDAARIQAELDARNRQQAEATERARRAAEADEALQRQLEERREQLAAQRAERDAEMAREEAVRLRVAALLEPTYANGLATLHDLRTSSESLASIAARIRRAQRNPDVDESLQLASDFLRWLGELGPIMERAGHFARSACDDGRNDWKAMFCGLDRELVPLSVLLFARSGRSRAEQARFINEVETIARRLAQTTRARERIAQRALAREGAAAPVASRQEAP